MYPGAPQKFCATVKLIHIRTCKHGQNIFASLFFCRLDRNQICMYSIQKIEIYLEIQQGRFYKSPDLKFRYETEITRSSLVLNLILVSVSTTSGLDVRRVHAVVEWKLKVRRSRFDTMKLITLLHIPSLKLDAPIYS